MNTEELPSFERDIADTLSAIEQCITSRQHMPAKVLTYSLIDSIAWACSEKNPRSTRKNFEEWVEKWLLPQLTVSGEPVRSHDLYAARCAVLHTMTPDSDLSKTGVARTIAYAWGTGATEFLDFAFASQGIKNVLAIHYDSLLNALRNGIADCLEAAEGDDRLRRNLEHARVKHYSYISAPKGKAQ